MGMNPLTNFSDEKKRPDTVGKLTKLTAGRSFGAVGISHCVECLQVSSTPKCTPESMPTVPQASARSYVSYFKRSRGTFKRSRGTFKRSRGTLKRSRGSLKRPNKEIWAPGAPK